MRKPAHTTSRLAAIVFERDAPVDDVMRAFIGALRGRGVKVAGLVQEPGKPSATCRCAT